MTAFPGSLYFGEWLNAYEGDDPISDLRDDFRRTMRQRKLTPLFFKTPSTLMIVMERQGACPEAIDALVKAAELYDKAPGAWESGVDW